MKKTKNEYSQLQSYIHPNVMNALSFTPIFSIIVFLLLTVSNISYGQYSETFSIPDKGILQGPCGATSGTCTSNDFTGVDWDINGDLSGVDNNDFVSTDGSDLSFEDVDEEVCFETPELDISGVVGNFSINVDVVWNGFDSDDYIDVEYKIDGGAWVQVANIIGGGDNTIEYTAPASNLNGSTTVSQTGLSGTSTLSVRICTDFNLFGTFENVSIDNVSVPEAGVIAGSSVSFTALDDLCVDAGNQVGQGGGVPTGGVYSGTGVTDDGNGMTYSFDPAAAGIGVHTITYTESGISESDEVEVFALPTVTFTALADQCVDAGVQTGLTGGTPSGGVYSGAGTTDDGNGMTYSFDPAAAGVGTHTITYNYTDGNGCSGSASDDVEVFDMPVVSFTASMDLCVDAGVQTGQGGGTPSGGVYSGTGVTDDGNGTTYSFDPATAGVGVHTITYDYMDANGCSNSASDDIEVFDLPSVSFTALDDLCIDAGVQTGLNDGVPGGGVYSGTGVTDDGNGMTYSFDPAVAGVGVHTITYDYNDTNGCMGTFSDDVEVFAIPTVTFTVSADICLDAGEQAGLGGGTPSGGVYSGSGVTDDGNGMTYSFDPTAAGVGTHTITYDYTDGNNCSNSASDDVEVIDPVVTFTAPMDLCINAGVQTGQGSGTPTGGVYSGSGVTDDGNGTSYSFNPAAAGVGTHTITYDYTDGNGCSGSASDDVEVFDLPVVSLSTALYYCLDAPIQDVALTGGSPSGGVYSGIGVTDNGNGIDYLFDPTVAGVGTVTITYTFTDGNGCTNSASSDIEIDDCEFEIDDPCACLDNATIFDCNSGAGGDDGQFSELVTISSAGGTLPSGQTWTVVGATGMFDAFNIPPSGMQSDGVPVASDGSVTLMFNSGVYELPFVHVDDIGYTVMIEGPFGMGSPANVTLTVSNRCQYPDPVFDPEVPLTINMADPVITLGGMDSNGGSADGVTFTLDGNPETEIDPSTLALGTHTVTMTYDGADDGNGGISPDGGTTSASPGCIQDVTKDFEIVDCDLVVDCSNIVDEQIACRADLPPVDFDLPIIVDSCGTVIPSALTIIPGNSGCPGDTIFVTRTYFLQDAAGNMAQCMQTFTIVDDVPPVMVCQPFTLEIDDAGMAPVLLTSDIDAGSTANCGSAVTLSLSQSVFTCADVGDNDVWLIGEDDCGNIDSCLAVVTVEDNIDPEITCPMDITMNADTDRCTAVVCFDVDVTDNCEAVLPEAIDDYTFLGTLDGHNYFVSDPGNTLLWEEANEEAAALGGHLVVVSSDAEQDFLIDNIPNGTYWIGLRYSPSLDAFKWVNGEPFVYDAWGPGQPGGILEGDYVFNWDFFGSILDGWYDAPSILPIRYIVEIETYSTELTEGLPPGSNFPVGITEVTYVASDASGNTDECSFNVTVIDNQAPVIDCPENIVIQLMEEQCDTLAAIDIPDFTDNCPDAVITQIEGVTLGTPFPIGENVVSFEARDTSGNADTCTFSITVLDFIPNGLACKGEINFSVDEMTCSGSMTPSMVIDVTSVGCPDSITITVTGDDGITKPADFTSADIGKSFDYEICAGGICCWGIVNVEFKFKPVILCTESDTLSCTQSFDESLITPDVSMSCASVELIKVDEFVDYLSCDTMFTAKMTTLYTAIDEYGNTSDTCTQTIFLERTNLDSITPVLPFALFNNQALDCGSGFATTEQGYPFPALSVTGAPRLKLENGEFVDLFPFESNVICNGFAVYEDEILDGSTSCVTKIMRTFTIGEWWCSETNERDFTQLIEVVDFTGPSVTCPSDLTISTASFSCAGFSAFDLPTASDACNGGGIRIDLSAPTSPTGFIKDYAGQVLELPVGINELTYHVYDGCDNRTDCTFNVTVRDDADPIAICDQFTSIGIGLDNLTKVYATAIDDGSFDECGPVDLAIARMDSPGFDDLIGFGPDVDITCTDVGSVVMVGLLVTDAGGNTNMCMVAIEVTDKIDAQFTCPGDMEVECNFPYDPDNLGAFFGEVVIYDNCPEANTVDDKILGSLNSCGSGILTREIRLLNAQGEMVDYCTQQITFRSGDPLQFSDITPPPAERTVTGCGIESIDPSILGMPIVPDGECQQTAIGIENDTFPFTANGACLKIIRTFKVIDWCIDDGPGSVLQPFEFTQTIKVNNTVGPEIENVFADSIFCSYEIGCGAINIDGYLTATSTDDCTAADDLLNRFEVKDSDGIIVNFGSGLDASGTYDVDTYTVRFISEDKCGNQEFEESTFEVRSCKLPTPYCLNGLSTTLIAMDTTGDGSADVEMVMLPASFFDAGSYHPCGYSVQLSYSSDVNDTIRRFFCSDTLGLQPIELWVTDENGGQSFCSTFVDIQDNVDIELCGGLKPVDVGGRIYTELDMEVPSVPVELRSTESIQTLTDENGIYEFANMPQGGNYEVMPKKDDDHLNGVSTLDLVLIQRHILGIAPLENVYKKLAADINNDKKITASDLLTLRKVILGIEMGFENNTSWRFIDSEYDFVNEDNPWETEIEETNKINGLSSDIQVDFLAVKTGDVNGNVDVNNALGEEIETRSNSTLTMELPNVSVEKGNLYEVEVRSIESLEIHGMQYSLDLKGLELIDVIPASMDMRKAYTSQRDGQLHVSYASIDGDRLESEEVMYTMVMKATTDGQLSEMVSLSKAGISAESYQGEDLSTGNVDISWRDSNEATLVAQLNLIGNSPNPWRNSTEINFQLPRKGKVSLRVTDVNGRLLVSKEREFEAGENNFIITNDDVKISGILLYEMRFEDQISNSKMIRIE